MADKPRYYLTTAIAYPNGPPHIGHAYEAIATDAIARFMRLDGYEVLFLTGTDEHGIKMLQTAAKEKLTPQQLVERNVPRFKAMVERFNCSNDEFIRTTEERHHQASIGIWRRMEAAGDIYLGKYSGWYSVRDEAYYDEDETRLDERGERVGPQGTPVEWVEEESYFFRLSAYQQKLLDLYDRHPDFVLPRERFNEVIAFVKGGLRDLSISRTTFDWGVKVPGNTKHVMYVWVDALTNYITAIGYPDVDSPKFRRYWPADLHVIGKDIVRFHAVYWPAFLISAGIREVPFGQDGNYSLEAIANRINADLANDLGNLAQRSLTMIARQLGGVLPKPGAFSGADAAMLALADGMIKRAREAMQTQQLHQVLNAVWSVVAEANRYFAGEAPWALAKTNPTRQGTVLYVTAEVIRQIAILAQPFVPSAAAKLLDLLAIPASERAFHALGGARRIAVVARARAAGIARIVTISTRVKRHAEVLGIAERFPDVYCSVGTHPHYAHEELDITVDELIGRTNHPKVVAIGEAGLDYHYERSPRAAQEQGLRNHIAVARATGLPLVIHSREADEDMARILEEETGKGAFPAVLHCFTGGRDLARRAIAIGLFVSFTGIVTFKKSDELRAIAQSLPAERILLETDAPYLAPGRHRGKRNEPAYIVETATVVAEALGISLDAIARQTSENFFRLFRKVPPQTAGVDELKHPARA